MQRSIGGMFDYVTSSQSYGLLPLISDTNVVTARLFGTYPLTSYLGGIACNRSSDSGFAFTGTPCQTINFTRTCAGTAGTLYLMVLYSQMIMIDASGSVSIVR